MQEDNRVCEGNYESAMHYDCKICPAKCILRREVSSKAPLKLFLGVVLFLIVATIVLIRVVL